MLVLIANRKSHTRFRLVPKSTILDDLEGPLRTLSQNTCVFSEPTTKIWMKVRLAHYQWRRCTAVTLDYGNVRFMRIFAGVPWKGGVIQQWCNRKRVFSGLRTLRIRHLRKWGQHYYIVLFSSLSPFHGPQNTWPWMNLNGLKGHYTLCSLLRTATD